MKYHVFMNAINTVKSIHKQLLFTFAVFISTTLSFSQEDSLLEHYNAQAPAYFNPNKFEEKFLWGFQYNLGWTDMANIDSVSTFTKPGVGLVAKVSYFPKPWLGFSLGVGHQMRGYGRITTDYHQALGERDSTYRCRMRTNNIDIPIQVILRLKPFESMEHTRWSIIAGVTPTTIFMAKRVFLSVEDGFHEVTKIKDLYADGFDFPLHFGTGLDMNMGNNGALLRLHLFAELGMKDMYRNTINSPYSGRNRLGGLQITVMW